MPEKGASAADPFKFDQVLAAGYDARVRASIPGYEALHQAARDVLGEALPAEARVLVAGAGTGQEVLVMGAAFPGWRFTAADPSAPMLETLSRRVREAGFEGRASVHAALVKDLPASETGFDGAASLLISHFIEDVKDRQAYFRSIADRLKPGGFLVFADYHGDRESPAYQRLYDAWKGRCRRSDMPRDVLESLFARMDKDVALIPEERLLSMVQSAGFDRPVHFWRGLNFGAWYARRP